MKTKIQKYVMNLFAAALVLIAGTGIGPNSWFIAYEPEVPQALKRQV